MTTELILWRHGETEWNRETRFQGQTDVPLNELGELQAKAAAVKLAQAKPEIIYSSDLGRARRTAEALAQRTGLPVEVDERLREIDVGSWAGRTMDEVKVMFPDYQRLVDEHVDFPRSPEGETLGQVGVRVGEALLDIAARHEGHRIVIAGHGNGLRVGMAHVVGWEWSVLGGLAVMGNANWAVMRKRGHRWRVISYNRSAA
ncbi:histidine phosphatase family protein [Propionicicella superfundia]|uniref:histidine phosphatase family protein n=1 Tax=Propionicicella superfundia TaxID=348582 RepID=UPI000412F128|nr:histidine phosphatase family protein [Propionicicella superfundia]